MPTELPSPIRELGIVPVSEMPKPPVIHDAPTDDLVALFKIASQMWFLCDKEDGIGLAAAQVGIPWRMFVTTLDGHECFINCEYEPVGDRQGWSLEGCLSIPRGADNQRQSFVVRRNASVRVSGHRLVADKGLALEPVDEVVEGLRAVLMAHEIDHQHGIGIWSVGKPVKGIPASRP